MMNAYLEQENHYEERCYGFPLMMCHSDDGDLFTLGTLMMTMINAPGFHEVKGYYTPIHLDQHMGQPFTFPKSS